MGTVTAHEEAQTAKALKHRQNQQIGNAVHTACTGAKLRLKLFLPLGNGYQPHLNTANGNLIFLFQGADGYRLSVYQDAVLGIGIRYRPASVIIPGQDRMIPGYRWGVNAHIAGFAAAHHIFPVGQGELAAVLHHQPGPDLRLSLKCQKWMQTAPQQHNGNHRCRVTQKTDIHIHIGFFCLSKTHQKGFHGLTSVNSLGFLYK